VGLTAKNAIRRWVADSVLVGWQRQLSGPAYEEQRVVRAVLPVFDRWMGRPWGRITFRVAQVLTGHGCFGRYLCRIGREASPGCHHSEEDQDTAQHTLEACPAWEVQRRVLISVTGEDLSLAAVVREMVRDEKAWRAVTAFCEDVMAAKEVAERERRRDRRRMPPTAGARCGQESSAREEEAAWSSGLSAEPPVRRRRLG